MAFPTSVNEQVTDSVTQSNVKVLGEAPAMAMASLYQSAAHSLGLAAQNAVAAQQQMNVTLQAATAVGAAHIYNPVGTDTPQAVEANLASAKASLGNTALTNPINQQIEEAINQALKSVLGSAGEVSYTIRAVMDALAVSLEKISLNQYQCALDVIKIAALSSTLSAMINKPENASSYQQILEIIERL